MARRLTTGLILAFFFIISMSAKDIDIRTCGAKGDGRTFATQALQKAIDNVSSAGGGRVIVSGGTYLIKPVRMKSGVELYIDADATLLASPNIEDYPERTDTKYITNDLPRFRNVSLIYAEQADNIAISGRGKIDCNGTHFVHPNEKENWTGFPYVRTAEVEKSFARVVFFVGCRNVSVTDITMQNQPSGWSFWINDCDFVNFDRCKILANVGYMNNDGIHINSSRNVAVSNCFIETGDDCIVVRANNRPLHENKVCERVVITNCTLRSWCYGIRIAFTNDGVIRNCTFSNLVIYDTTNGIGIDIPPKALKNDWGREATLVENMSFSNIEMSGVTSWPISFMVSDNEEVMFEGIRNISFDNVRCYSRKFPYIRGLKGKPIENISFSNCSFTRVSESELPDWRRHGGCASEKSPVDIYLKNTKNITFDNTNFNDNR